MLECDVPSNGTRRRSCGGELLREMQERDGRIEDVAQVFDEMPIRVVVENARVLLLGEASRVHDAVGRMLQWRAGRSHAVREVLRCDDLGRTRPGGSRAAKTLKAVEEKAVDEIRRHCELFVEDLEVARCEQTMALAEVERASVAR
jgi:hypothetical protein